MGTKMQVKPIPEGYHTVTLFLLVEGGTRLIDFLKQAFGATERFRMAGPDGKLGHAEVQIGDSIVMVADACGEHKAKTSMIHLYVPDADAAYRSALKAGATSEREPADQFYGDRAASVRDQFGNSWYIATHKEDVAPDELQRRAEAAMKQHQG